MNRQAAAERLWSGSGLLAARIARWAADWCRKARKPQYSGWKASLDPLLRAVILGAVVYGLWRVVRAVPGLLWLLVPGWWAAAWAVGKPPAGASVEAPAEEPDEPPAEAPAGPGRDAVLTLLQQLIADRPGVHLATILTRLQETGQGEGWTVSDVRARLAALGVPSRRSVKVDRRVAWGVHRGDLPAPAPAEATERAA